MDIKPEVSRTAMLLGAEATEKLAAARVAVFGLGGVGGAIAEALARAGVGHLTLIDGDTVSLSNINRQVFALHSTVGRLKTEVARERILDINPDCEVKIHSVFYSEENAGLIDYTNLDYIADAIDTVSSKLLIIERATTAGTRVISSMGTGNKLDASALTLTDISKTQSCPLARVMRRELRLRGIDHLRVVFSPEPPRTPDASLCDEEPGKRTPPGTFAPLPNVAGLLIAGEIIRSLAGADQIGTSEK